MTATKAWTVEDEVRRIACGFCGARPKAPCVSRADDRIVPEGHLSRWQAARDAGRIPRQPALPPVRGTTPGEDWSVRLMAGVTTVDHEAREQARRDEARADAAGGRT